MIRIRRRAALTSVAVLLGLSGALLAAPAGAEATTTTRTTTKASSVWPAQGEAAYVFGAKGMRTSPHQPVVPIASVAKVMTAYLVLKAAPLDAHHNGFTLTVTQADVDDTARRVARDESVVPVKVGEKLTERQALAALLLPSANNVAIMLARKVGGTVAHFVARMNSTAKALGLPHTHYTDPSGFDAHTVSTAGDQTRFAVIALRTAVLAQTVALRSAWIPVAGTVHNYDTLLGTGGFVGVKTGSDDAAGGCFVFRARRSVNGHNVWVTGAVFGQKGSDIIAAALNASRRLVDRVAPHPAS